MESATCDVGSIVGGQLEITFDSALGRQPFHVEYISNRREVDLM